MVVVVLDNGGSSIKAGILFNRKPEPRIVPNAVIRAPGDKATYIGHEFHQRCRDFSSLSYRLPLEKGFVVDWDAQKAVWDGLFSDEVLNVNPTESTLVITEPYFNLPKLQEVYDQFVFEEYEFQGLFRATPASFIPHGTLLGETPPECSLIVDSGFSFTHVVPIMQGQVVLDLGGKLLTNHLKELISFRQWNMMEETYMMNHVKETCCYVAQDFGQDLEVCRNDPKNSIVQEYVLPDLTKQNAGRIRQPNEVLLETDQVLTMGNERFSVPEIMFRPDDVGLKQVGIAGTIASSIALLPEDLQGLFWANIGLIGGNTEFPGFRTRLIPELESLAPMGTDVAIYHADKPSLAAYEAACAFASQPHFESEIAITREEYLEYGSTAVRRKCPDWRAGPPPPPATSRKGKGRSEGPSSDVEESEDSESDTDDGDRSVVRRGKRKAGRAAGKVTVSRKK
ncbi:unnamed protein product [Mycena citricolor]|uniref:Actin-like protein ARP6 n=1 Tax=Mycena citricolor TaxID=2018698 RepID=A0AAD2K598_9AGAR|nr:unnamed protein product [Mycena citricolor]